MKKRSGTSKGRKYHSWWPQLYVAADEHRCTRCGLRIKQVPRKAEVTVYFPEHGPKTYWGPLFLRTTRIITVYYVKFPGIRRWQPRLPTQLVDCTGAKKGTHL